jgi:hypothetical protein
MKTIEHKLLVNVDLVEAFYYRDTWLLEIQIGNELHKVVSEGA